MTGVSSEIEYPNTPYIQQNVIASPAQTPFVWLIVPVLVIANNRCAW